MGTPVIFQTNNWTSGERDYANKKGAKWHLGFNTP